VVACGASQELELGGRLGDGELDAVAAAATHRYLWGDPPQAPRPALVAPRGANSQSSVQMPDSRTLWIALIGRALKKVDDELRVRAAARALDQEEEVDIDNDENNGKS